MTRTQAAEAEVIKWRTRAMGSRQVEERQLFLLLERNWEFIAASYELLDRDLRRTLP